MSDQHPLCVVHDGAILLRLSKPKLGKPWSGYRKADAEHVALLINAQADHADTLAGLLQDTFARLDEMRDAMLHSRGPMAESVEDSDQVNAVLGVFDDYYPSDIKTAFAALSDGDGERGGGS